MYLLQKEFLDLRAAIVVGDQVKMHFDATSWFKEQMEEDVRQALGLVVLMEEAVRAGKAPAEWENLREILCVLVCENQRHPKSDVKVDINGDLDDALRGMFKFACERLRRDPVVPDPTTADGKLADEKGDLINRLYERFEEVLKILEVLDEPDCPKVRAAEAWCKVLPIPFFRKLLKKLEREIKDAVTAGKIRPIGPAIIGGGGVVVVPGAKGVTPPKSYGWPTAKEIGSAGRRDMVIVPNEGGKPSWSNGWASVSVTVTAYVDTDADAGHDC